MEITSKSRERETPSPIPSPSPSSTPNFINNNNGFLSPQIKQPPISRSDTTNTYPTTFVQADTSSFKQVVQMLTGSSDTSSSKQNSNIKPSNNIPPIKSSQKKQSNFKLYERRNSNLKASLMINPSISGFMNSSSFSPRKAEILSPSLLDFPKLVLSPVTPLIEDPFNKSSPSIASSSEEEKAIAEKGFYLHPSPMSTPRDTEPQLLPLFPVTSPRVSGSSS
ncbi:VQ protein [Dillenia turbinata]|uniref:VQ protein n=1 Tax=Dillenia turbinata TaxID=194707 RepID=A0AAN8WHP7_9MAGN